MNTVLITGATGAIGSTLVPLLLRGGESAVRLVIRARSPQHLRERLETLCDFWKVDSTGLLASGRLQAFRGDVCQPFLGLNGSEYRRLVGESTHVVHAAGNVKLNQPREEARREAVDSARHIVDFSAACRERGQFRKLDFVSTVGVAGRTQGVVPEQPLDNDREFRNTYEAAKAEAETLLLREMHRGLPATIHRPSMVVGDSRTGKIIHFQVFYYVSEFLSGKKTWGIVPDPGHMKLDIVPVDYVARAIQIASARDDAAGRIFHLCSGPENALGLPDMAKRVREIFASHGARLPRLRPVPRAWLRALLPLITRVAPVGSRRALQTLPFFLTYLDETQLFDNTNTRAFFSEVGLVVPPVEAYLGNILHYYFVSRQNRGSQSGDTTHEDQRRGVACKEEWRAHR